MPWLEALSLNGAHTEERGIGGLDVSLGRSLGVFRVPKGFLVVMDRPIPIPEETDAHGLLDILGRSVRLKMTTKYPVVARMSERGLNIGTDQPHVTQMMHTFFRTHNNEMRVLPECSGDAILVNNQIMEKGISVPLYPNQRVEFVSA